MLDDKQMWAIFLPRFKMGHKAMETSLSINQHLAQELLVNTLQRRLEHGRWGAQWLAIRSWQWPTETIFNADSLTTTQKVAQELNINHSRVIRHLKQTGKVKMLDMRVPYELISSKKKCFEVSFSLILCNNSEPLLDLIVICDEKWFYMTTSNDQLSGWTKKKLQGISKSQNSTKKESLTLFGGLLPICSTITFWIPVKPFYLRSMLSTSMRCSNTCNTCSQYWPTGRVLFLSTTMPDHTSFKSWTNWVTKFCLICHIRLTFSQLTTLFQASQQHFAGKILLYPTGGRKCFPRVQQILKHGFLCYRKKQTYFSLAKKRWL